jgi:ribonucleotide monophosphatase NagD (HAD superfamily)
MDIREQLSKIRCFLLDMDGTFYLGNQLIDGSLDFLDALKRTGRQCLFLTNNSSKSASFYKEKLKKMGVPEEFRSVVWEGSMPVPEEFKIHAKDEE